jgi:hypothetical protein
MLTAKKNLSLFSFFAMFYNNLTIPILEANVIRVKRREIQTLHCSKPFNFSNAYSAQDFRY